MSNDLAKFKSYFNKIRKKEVKQLTRDLYIIEAKDAVINGNLEILQYIILKSKTLDIHVDNDFLIRMAIKYNYYHIFTFLIENYDMFIYVFNMCNIDIDLTKLILYTVNHKNNTILSYIIEFYHIIIEN